MHRLIVVILAAVDAAIAAAVGIAATLAPLTVLWVLGMDGTADWGTLWPASAAIWQLGNLVPLQVTLPGDYLAAAGIDPGAASFVLSLAPLAFASFTAIFAARSGVRASRADAWVTGVLTGSAVFASLAAVIALTSANSLAEAELWQAILLPSLVFALPLLAGAFVTEWREAGSGFLARARDRIEAAPRGWGEAPGLIVRGAAVVLAGLIGLGALVFAVSLVLRGGEVIALFEAAHVDVLGATIVTLAQLAYLPDARHLGARLRGRAGLRGRRRHGGVTGGHAARRDPRHPRARRASRVHHAVAAAARAAAGRARRARRLDRPFPPRRTPAATAARRRRRPRTFPMEWDAAPDAARSSALTALLAEAEASRPAAGSDAVEDDAPVDADGRRPLTSRSARASSSRSASPRSPLRGPRCSRCSLPDRSGPGRLAEVGPQPGPVALAVGRRGAARCGHSAALAATPPQGPREPERDAATPHAERRPRLRRPSRADGAPLAPARIPSRRAEPVRRDRRAGRVAAAHAVREADPTDPRPPGAPPARPTPTAPRPSTSVPAGPSRSRR